MLRLMTVCAAALIFSIPSIAAESDFCPVAKMAAWQRTVVMAQNDRAIFSVKNHLTAPDKPENFDFSFSATIAQILKSAGLSSDKNAQIRSVQSLIDTFKATSFNAGPGRNIPAPPRKVESLLQAAQMLDETSANGLHPIGLFNRFDQAPDTWRYCGEHRIVYAQGKLQPDGSVSAPGTHRFFLIFEAAVTNPRPDLAQEGCRPIANLWQSLATLKAASGSQADELKEIARRMHNFYYAGLKNAANPSLNIEPVIDVRHYGNPFGQVRANLFDELPWELRQWRVDPSTGSFVAMQVGTNPQPALYSDLTSPITTADPAVRIAFQKLFIEKIVPEILNSDQQFQQDKKAKVAVQQQTADLVNGVGIQSADLLAPFDDFISVSQTPFTFLSGAREDDPAALVQSNAFIKAVDDSIRQTITDPTITAPSAHEVLTQMGTTSCGGCHHFSASSSNSIGTTSDGESVKWPLSLGPPGLEFVHIDENSNLSPLLTKFFLAARCQNMNEIFFAAPAPPPPAPTFAKALTEAISPVSLVQSLNKTLPGLSGAQKAPVESALTEVIDLNRRLDRAEPGALGKPRHPD